MAKKRGRTGIPAPESTARASANGQNSSRAKPDRKFIILLFAIPVVSMICYRILYTSKIPDIPHVYPRAIDSTTIDFRQILDENVKISENLSQRNFKNPVLAYITPWNSLGYDMAKKFSNKFTHLSPVWYELKSAGSQETKMILEGRHNADKGWIEEIRRTGNPQILPRVVLEAIPTNLLKKKRQRDKAINIILAECKEMQYDGIVLESWSRWAAYGVLHDPDMRNMALQFIIELGHALHSVSFEQSNSRGLQLIFAIGPPRSNKMEVYDFGPGDLRKLSDAVDGFSLMTYDFSGPQNPGPNAPLKWIHSVLQLLLDGDSQKFGKKIFIGINFYGNDFVVSGGGGPIIGREYLSLLEQHEPQLLWEQNSAEHYFLYIDTQDVRHVVFYPSTVSISTRLQEALSWGAGISIWEIGQGLECFFHLL